MHIVIGTSEGIYLTSPALIPRLLPTSHGWPRGPSPKAPSSYEGVSLADPGSAQAVPHTTGFPGVVLARLHKRDLGCTSVAVTHGINCVPLEVQAIVLTVRYFPNPLHN